jgi:hypothetical protein
MMTPGEDLIKFADLRDLSTQRRCRFAVAAVTLLSSFRMSKPG